MVSQNPFAVTRRYSPPSDFDLPHPLADKLRSYEWLLNEGLEEVLRSVSPIADENAVYRYSLRLSDAIVDEPKYSPDDCRALKKTYAGMLRCKAVLHLLPQLSGEETIKEGRRIALTPLPLMTDNGSFVINGTERVVINQIVRSPGIVFMKEKDEKTGADSSGCKDNTQVRCLGTSDVRRGRRCVGGYRSEDANTSDDTVLCSGSNAPGDGGEAGRC